MAEWSKAAVLKTADCENGPGVRIPPSPPKALRYLECKVHVNTIVKLRVRTSAQADMWVWKYRSSSFVEMQLKAKQKFQLI